MGSPDTYDACKNCGEAIRWINNTGSWVHVEKHNQSAQATTCVSPVVVQVVKSVAGKSTATDGSAVKKT